jgi:hypothetical protein
MRILLPYWRGAPEHTFYQDFHEVLAEALRSLGHEPVRFTFQALGQAPQGEAEALLRQLDRGNFSAVFDLCCWAYGASRTSLAMQDGTKQPIFDAFGVPYAGMLYDQPYNQALNGVRAAKLYATYPDLGHAEQVRLVFPGLRLAGEIFVPPAIRPANDRSSGNGAADRDIDVLYVGNLVPEALDRYWRNPQSVLRDDAYDARFCDALADAALAEPGRSLHLSVRAALDGRTSTRSCAPWRATCATSCGAMRSSRLPGRACACAWSARDGTGSACPRTSSSVPRRTTTACSGLPRRRRSASTPRPTSMAPTTGSSATR